MKYNEEALLSELRDYIIGTYNQHYATDKIQTLDLIDACGDAEAFCRSNILKYASRYDRRGLPVVTLSRFCTTVFSFFISATNLQTVKSTLNDRNFKIYN